MTDQPSSEQENIGCTLSAFLSARHQAIVAEWMAAVQNDAAVPAADDLTPVQLKDHVPQILDDLNATLSDTANQDLKERAAFRAAIHGQIRWKQHYDISQVIREIADLRTILIYHLAEFSDARGPSLNRRLGVFSTVVVHAFLDRIIRISVEQFLATARTLNRSNE